MVENSRFLNLELSVQEIISKCPGFDLEIPKPGIRLLPLDVISSARSCLQQEGVEKALRYIENAFYIYRASVSRVMFAPHYFKNNAYEWPDPCNFHWRDINAVIFGGEFLEDPLSAESDETILIETREGDEVETTHLITQPRERQRAEIVDKYKQVRRFIPEKENLHKLLKYQIPDLRNIFLLLQFNWQNLCLEAYVNPVYEKEVELRKREIGEKKAIRFLQELLGTLSEPLL